MRRSDNNGDLAIFQYQKENANFQAISDSLFSLVLEYAGFNRPAFGKASNREAPTP